MKKVKITIYLLFFLTILIPIIRLILLWLDIGFNKGYIIEFTYALVYEIILDIVSIIILIIFFKNKFKIIDYISFTENISKNKIILIFLFLICPLSFINALFLIAYGPETRWQILFLLVNTSCCAVMTMFFARPLVLKIISLVISLLPAGITWLYCFIAFIFIGFTSRTVMNTIDSPSGKYYIEVIYADAGATGGSTLVEVNEKCKIDLVILKITKKSRIIYNGRLNEYKNMAVYWKDDNCVVINSKEYMLNQYN